MPDPINFADKLAKIPDFWQPRVGGERTAVNDQWI